jgi:hypothetical protein
MKKKTSSTDLSLSKDLFSELTLLIEQSKASIQFYVNSALTMLYWHIGKRINDDIL